MKKKLRKGTCGRIAGFALSALLGGSLFGCVDADSLPTEPYQVGIALETHVQDWRDEVIYQLIVDRFHNGDINNDFNVDTRSMSRYHGGDWQGIIDKLDYLQELGVTTLWISPVVKNVEEDAGFLPVFDLPRVLDAGFSQAQSALWRFGDVAPSFG